MTLSQTIAALIALGVVVIVLASCTHIGIEPKEFCDLVPCGL